MVRVRVCCLLVQIFNLGLDYKNSVPPIIEIPTILFILFYLPISHYHFSLTLPFHFSLPPSLRDPPSSHSPCKRCTQEARMLLTGSIFSTFCRTANRNPSTQRPIELDETS